MNKVSLSVDSAKLGPLKCLVELEFEGEGSGSIDTTMGLKSRLELIGMLRNAWIRKLSIVRKGSK